MEAGPRRLSSEVERRRTFAIISHPDAGKTTLTEKLLLFGGAVREAGAVRAQRAARYATSDWLELEKQRGISVSSSVMHFDHAGFRVNILDTPGHRDFSEDTYRTLLAADSAVMLIDAAKGVEAQTRKLFEVCRLRHIPIFTFVNKLDRQGRDPLELMTEIEEVLKIDVVPLSWPIGAGSEFRGVYDRVGERSLYFSGGKHGTQLLDQREVAGPPDDPRVRDALELLDGAGAKFQPLEVARGKQTPMFFGSALTNYGVLPFLERFLELAPCPGLRETASGPIDPARSEFSGFVFKIQANMDPDHRDRVAFLRICSGRFERGADAVIARTGKPVRLAHSTLLMGQGREEVDEAFPGDVVGLFDPGVFRIGDSLSTERQDRPPRRSRSSRPSTSAGSRSPGSSAARRWPRASTSSPRKGRSRSSPSPAPAPRRPCSGWSARCSSTCWYTAWSPSTGWSCVSRPCRTRSRAGCRAPSTPTCCATPTR